MDSITLTASFPVTAATLYRAWLNSEEHGAFTGAPANIHATKGSSFSAWEAYISGTILELVADSSIVQSWRTTEFPDEAEDSLLNIVLEDIPEGCELTVVHTRIPAGDGPKYRAGWEDYYFAPMQAYFGRFDP